MQHSVAYRTSHHGAIVPPEILDQIIDHSHDDLDTLLSLSLVCKQMLYRSRLHSFSNLELVDNDERLDRLLTILDVPQSSLGHVVEHIVLKGLFHRSYMYSTGRDLSKIAQNLRNVKSVLVIPIDSRCILWDHIPAQILELVLRLDTQELRFNSVITLGPRRALSIFSRLQSSAVVPYQKDEIPHNALKNIMDTIDSSICHRPLQFALLDIPSHDLYQYILDPLITEQLDIIVEKFHIGGLPEDPPLTGFGYHIGLSFQRLCSEFPELSSSNPDDSQPSEFTDFYGCTNAHEVHVGGIPLQEGSPRMQMVVQTLWQLLSAVGSSSVQEISLAFYTVYSPLSSSLKALESFEWLDFVTRLQHIFPEVEKIAIEVEGRGNVKLCLETLRGSRGLEDLERQGMVEFRVIGTCGNVLMSFCSLGMISAALC